MVTVVKIKTGSQLQMFFPIDLNITHESRVLVGVIYSIERLSLGNCFTE
jgi:hypothetical protein